MPDTHVYRLSEKAEKHDLGSQAGGQNKPKKKKRSIFDTYKLARQKLGTIREAVKSANEGSPIRKARQKTRDDSMLAYEYRKREAKLRRLAKQHTTNFAKGK